MNASPSSLFAPVEVTRTARPGGGFVLRSSAPLGEPARAVGDRLVHWAHAAPTRTFLAERGPDGAWVHLSYADTYRAVRSLAQSLLDFGLGPTRPLLVLSGNGVHHALLQLAALHVGVPVAPLSPAYSLLSRDFARLRALAAVVAPGAVYAADGEAFAPALAALDLGVPTLVSRAPRGSALTVDALRNTAPGAAVDAAFARVSSDTVAKILFTSGSTGSPKGVVNTQRMLCSNQQAIAGSWPFLAARPPVVLDWLPWSHTFGGNHNFNLVLWHGGTLYLDAGKAAPGAFEETARNLRDVSPTVYFNVPRGYDLLASRLEADPALRDRFFADLDVLFYAAAALAPSTWARLAALSRAARGDVVAMTAAWGLTETSPLATQVHAFVDRPGNIGVPARGCEIAFVPDGPKLELRVKGPNVSPGYWNSGGSVTPLALDEQGFFATGDAGLLADEADPARGVVFDGRLAENFKLTSGTWVNVGELRVALIAACAPLVADAVITGHGRDDVGALVFLSPDAAGVADVDAALGERLARFNAERPGSSTAVARLHVLTEPPQIDHGEITDKGYLNQRALLARRAADVESLYARTRGGGSAG